MFDLLNIILPTFFVIIIGYLLGKFTKLDMSPVVDVLFYIGLPAIAFVSMLTKDIVLIEATKVWASAILVMFGSGVLAFIAFKIVKQKHSGLYLPIIIMNTVNIPFPIIYLAYGSEGLFAATLYYIPNVLFLYSIGIMILARKHWKEGIKEMAKVPTIYAALVGLILNLLDVQIPTLIFNPLEFLSTMVIPLVLLVLGSKLSSVKITALPTTLMASAIRLGGGFLLGLAAANLFGLTGVLRSVVILDSAMPAAVNSSLLAMKYENEADLIASMVFVTTVVSILTIPLLLYTLG